MSAALSAPSLSQPSDVDHRPDAGRHAGTDRYPEAREPLAAVVGANLQAPLVGGGEVRYANLDYAASAPALVEVAEHLEEILPFYASVHRGAGYASQISTSVYENARSVVRAFVGARAEDAVVFTRNTTDSLNLLAGCVPDGLDVLYLDIEHHANLLPWQARAHRSVGAAGTLAETLERLRAELEGGGIGLLAVTGASNVTGEILPLTGLAALAHEYGARIAVDAAQLAPHRRIDMTGTSRADGTDTGIDYLAFSGHKLYAPFGSGVLVGRPDWLDAGRPHLAGGGAVREVRLESVNWAVGPARHEAGSPNVLGAATLARAAQALGALDPGAWHRHEQQLRDALVTGLGEIEGITVHRLFEDSESAIGVVNFTVIGHDAGLVAAYLSAEHGVGLRDGKFCAHPLLARLGLPAGSLRASFGLGSRLEDVERLLAGVRELRTHGLGIDYTVDEGRWVPAHDPRPFPAWAPNTPGTAGAAPCLVGE
ncbi:aminotransferase class V-fold PLP-dependent enzyme [Sinomonas sp. P10A9]|uniref:Aminotransferase class V-fold PLP-dependent enzyme n=1 Tax=Sinomonas puerhi TaxID=3238584 RepID=A0AB39L0V4_9MICC